MKVKVKNISTEMINERTKNIDSLSIENQIKLILEEDKVVNKALNDSLENIVKLIKKVTIIIKNGGRVFYLGAGTSGRLGVLDASEILPTYGESKIFNGIIAGGKKAIIEPVEDAEDDTAQAVLDLKEAQIKKGDIVIGITASGRTPYVISGIKWANNNNIFTGSISNSKNSEISSFSKNPIELNTGPEVITGSTRMKSGTSQKILLNIISTVAMINNGKVYKNFMVDLKATNNKLKARSLEIIMDIADVDENSANKLLLRSNGSVKHAILMYFKNVNYEEAKKILKMNDGFLRRSI